MVMTNKIELSENSIQILNKQELTDKHIMIVKIDIGNLPTHKAIEYMENIKSVFADKIKPAELIIMPSSSTVEVYEKS